MQKNAPDFIGIGADHSGLGIIASLLSAHPQIHKSIPATHFFSSPTFDEAKLPQYEAQMPVRQKKELVGECSASYLSAPGVADRIVAAYPTTKLFVIVRHPLERAIAVYESAKKTGRIAANVSCAQYLVDHETVQSDGFYGQHLHDFFTYYTSLQLHMIVYEDFVENPLKVIQDLFGFLEVDTQFIPKALAAYAPPPDEPKHRSRLSRLIHWCATRLKALTAKPTVPVTPPPYQLTQYFSPAELAAFSKALQPDCAHLTNVMHRDMGVFWNITDAGRE